MARAERARSAESCEGKPNASPYGSVCVALVLPEATAFGEGWSSIGMVPVNVSNQPYLQDGAYALYGGPQGARVLIELYVVQEGAAARRSAWTMGEKRLDVQTTGNLILDEDTTATPPAASNGCAESERVAGVERWNGIYPGGLILCSAAPNVVFLVYTSGEIANLTGSDAASWVAGLVTGKRAGA